MPAFGFITDYQYEAAMRRHGTGEWTADDAETVRKYLEQHGAPEETVTAVAGEVEEEESSPGSSSSTSSEKTENSDSSSSTSDQSPVLTTEPPSSKDQTDSRFCTFDGWNERDYRPPSA
jgi:hypothetical protein